MDTLQINEMNTGLSANRKVACVTMEAETKVAKDYQGCQRATKS